MSTHVGIHNDDNGQHDKMRIHEEQAKTCSKSIPDGAKIHWLLNDVKIRLKSLMLGGVQLCVMGWVRGGKKVYR